MTHEHPNTPSHGITLEVILFRLAEQYGNVVEGVEPAHQNPLLL